MARTAIILGASGAIGRELVPLILDDSRYSKVTVIGRRPLPSQYQSNKLRQVIVDFEQLKQYQSLIVGDDLFICFGTTIKQAGSKTKFTEIDFDIPVTLAQIAKQNGVTRIAFVSSIGASPTASSFYLGLKGRTEQSLLACEFDRTLVLRPSVLMGHRDETRIGERFAAGLLNCFSWLTSLTRYQPISTKKVAKQMVKRINANKKKFEIIENSALHSD